MAAQKKTSEEKKRGLMLRLPPTLHTALRHVSIDRGQSLNTLISEVLENWWAKQPERPMYTTAGSKPTRSRGLS